MNVCSLSLVLLVASDVSLNEVYNVTSIQRSFRPTFLRFFESLQLLFFLSVYAIVVKRDKSSSKLVFHVRSLRPVGSVYNFYVIHTARLAANSLSTIYFLARASNPIYGSLYVYLCACVCFALICLICVVEPLLP